MNICIFASANPVGPEYALPAFELGKALGSAGCSLVFGGYADGLMKAAADGFAAANADITGVVTDFFDSEKDHYPHLTNTVTCASLSERKDRMTRLSDAFIVLPGGIGTLDEVFSVLCAKSCNQAKGAVLFYNTLGFWDEALKMLQDMRRRGFIRSDMDGAYTVCQTPEDALRALGL